MWFKVTTLSFQCNHIAGSLRMQAGQAVIMKHLLYSWLNHNRNTLLSSPDYSHRTWKFLIILNVKNSLIVGCLERYLFFYFSLRTVYCLVMYMYMFNIYRYLCYAK